MSTIYFPIDRSLISYGFGYPPGYGGFHNGIDFSISQGTPLIATAEGTIRNVNAGDKDGWGVDIITTDGWKVRVWHVSQFMLKNGAKVQVGDIIALSGGAKGTPGAGNSTGAHLHWGVATDGRDGWVNPEDLNPQNYNPTPPPLPEGLKMANIYINSETGANTLMNPETGFEWVIVSPEYKDLVKAMGLVQQEIIATPEQIDFLRQIAKK